MLNLVLLFLCISAVRGEVKCCYDTDDVPPDDGCYTDQYPFDNMPLPDCNEDIQVSMRLYTRANQEDGVVITRTTIPREFNPEWGTHFLVHGWLGSRNNRWLHNMKDDVLGHGDQNVIIVGWSGSSQQLWYPQSASDTRVVGTEMSLVARTLVRFYGATFDQMYCTGHSLGGHVCGHCGQRAEGTWGRITGMDPAGPWFENKDHPDIGLDATDAALVDVIHTNGEAGIILNLGTMKPLGHMDFYPNGGGTMPGCILDPFLLNKTLDIDDPDQLIDLTPACSHFRAVEFYRESVNSCNFYSSVECTDPYDIPGSCSDAGQDIASMGYGANSFSQHGVFFLETERDEPFCKD